MIADRDSSESRKGSIVDKIALGCALVSIACVLGAHAMDKLAQAGALPTISFNHPGQIDYAPTASISHRAAASQLNPCGDGR
jgi:hypothetical protein